MRHTHGVRRLMNIVRARLQKQQLMESADGPFFQLAASLAREFAIAIAWCVRACARAARRLLIRGCEEPLSSWRAQGLH